MLLDIKKIRQLRNHCGPCCVEIVLKFLGMENIDQEMIGKAIHLKENRGSLPHHLIRYLKSMGISADKLKTHHPKEYLLGRVPIIIGTRSHFTILYGCEKDLYLIYDAETGKTEKKKLDYFRRNVRDYIVVREVKDMTRTKKTKEVDEAILTDILCRLRKLDGRLDNLEIDINGVKKAAGIFSWVLKIGTTVIGIGTGVFKLLEIMRGKRGRQ